MASAFLCAALASALQTSFALLAKLAHRSSAILYSALALSFEASYSDFVVAAVAAVPEPTSLALLGVAGAGLLARRRRRERRRAAGPPQQGRAAEFSIRLPTSSA